jgi:hypothetical protein
MNIRRVTFSLLLSIMMFLFSTNLENIKYFSDDNVQIANAQNTRNSKWKQKEIIVTVWNSAEPDSSAYKGMALDKYNLIPINHQLGIISIDNLVKKLDVAEKNNLRGVFGHGLLNPANLHEPTKRKELDGLIDRVKKYRALEAYFITDEPSADKFSEYAELVAYLHKKDPARLAYINLLPYADKTQLGISANTFDRTKIKYPVNLHEIGLDDKNILAYLEYLRRFITMVKPDLISYDHYHLFKNGDGQRYFVNLALISQVAREAKIPFMNIIQAGKFLKEWRLPTAKEIRFQVYTTLAYGGKGISYFTYWGSEADEGLYRDGKQSLLAKDVGKINAEIRKLSPILMSLNSRGVYHTEPLPVGGEKIPKDSPIKVLSKGEFVIGLFGKAKKITTFMIVNRNYKDKQKAEIQVNISGKRLQELERETGKWIGVAKLSFDRKIKLTLEPGDGHLFRVI